ncbi:MAG: AMP-binding protein, partial [Pseudomonadota bacterium]
MTRFRGPPLHAPFNLANVLHKGLSERPDAAAVITMDDTLSWRELDRQSDCLAKNYTALGLRAGDRVATLMPNRTALIVHHLACLKASLISTPLNYRYTASEIDHALEVAEPSLLIHHAERDADIAATARARGLPFGTLRYGAQEAGSQQAGAREAAPQTQRPLEPLLVSAPQVALPPIKPSSPLFIFFTSGSTGPAKGVTHTVETVGFWLVNLREGLGLREDDIIMTTTSHSYVGGTSFALLAFSLGVPLVMARTNEGAEVFPLMRKARPTITWMLPSTLFALIT